MDPVSDKLEQARRDLLDLGLRNTLLNYRELKSKGVRIVDERPDEVFRILVEEGRSMSFLAAPEEGGEGPVSDIAQELASILEEQMRKGEEDEVDARHKGTKLQTPYTAGRLQYRLLNTYYAARTALEEQGVNLLFLALGMLDWYEDESSDQVHRAPLVLIPVSLSRESVRARFKVEYTGDEIDTNLSLQLKLKAEYGVDLPPVVEEDAGFAVQGYFESVARAVRHLPRWRVDRQAIVLGFFSFSKLLMYKDLDQANWPEDRKPSDHGVLRSLLHDGFRESDPLVGENEDLDERIDPADLYQVCDADSSQTMALLEAKTGRDLVIQGPPGTGKSQTITNLVAAAIADGKTLLFVSEKMAALEVVKRRLDQLGLGDACLELHSHKTNKKAVLAELQRTLELGRPRHEGRDQSAEELMQARERLNRYCRAVHAPIGESAVSPYRAYGMLLRLQKRLNGVDVPAIEEMEPREWSESEYAERRSLTEELQALLARIGIPEEHPFWRSSRTVYLPSDRPLVEEKSRTARLCLEAVRQATTQLCDPLGVDAPPDLPVLKSLIRTVRNALTLAAYRPKWWRFLSKRYRQARREIFALYGADPPGSCKGINDIFAAANAILRALELDTEDLSEGIQNLLNDQEGRRALQDSIEKVETSLDAYRRVAEEAMKTVELDESTRFGDGGLSTVAFDLQDALFRAWEEDAARLQDMVSWNHLTTRMREQGLAPVVEVAIAWEPAAEHLVDLLDQARYRLLVEEAMRERPELAGFDGQTHAHVVQKFCDLDKRLLELTQAYLARKHWERLPARTGAGQIAVLRREFEKKRRHRPIRQLMLDAGQAIQAIKPIFMMSPLSVAAYIPPGSVQFDLVVFDEASQVRPADAFGAILRGEHAVVVGDSRQLPPTSFFDKVSAIDEEQEEEWDAGTADLESVLGLFLAQGAPEVMLRWHYRSRHQSLIAVSNHEFYDDKLVVFPAPDKTRQDVGLIFRHLPDTTYERGKAVNRDEAAIVAQAVMEHTRKHPDLTLGVASFGIAQMRAIQDELEILRHRDPSCEGFFAAHPEEPFFVKNLENVQGDERDVIFISVGYGRTREGYLTMNFGPLNKEGGARRLNVLITRARRRCEVFSNLRADDIDLTRTNARGVVALRAFLKYAETGILDVARPQEGEAESPFEEAVAQALRGLGFEVHHQVGSAGFRVDLAVVDPKRPGRYLLGIECDGATYHSARWARDRDRLRQEVLKSLGWRIHRIWSTDWFRGPERELRRVVESIEKAKVGRGTTETLKPADPPVPSPGISPEGGDNGIEREPSRPSRYGIKVPPYRMASVAIDLAGWELHEVPTTRLAEWIGEVVTMESPVHLLEVASRIASAAGIKRVGHRIRAAIERGAVLAARRSRVRRQGDFLWRPDMKTAPVRDRGQLPYASREIERVPPEELAEAVVLIVDGSVGVTQEEAVVEACRLLGYARVTDSIRQHAEQAIQTLLADKRLRLHNGFLMLR